MRGKAMLHIFLEDRIGITPAYAGKRWFGLFPNLYI